MVTRVLTVVVVFLLASCSTLKNDYYQDFYIRTNEYDKVSIVDTTYTLPAMVKLKRSSKDIVATLSSEQDSVKPEQKVLFKGRLSPEFWLGNLFLGAPSGYFIDLTNPKRYHYNKGLLLNESNEVVGKFYNEPLEEEESTGFWKNAFSFNPSGGVKKEFVLIDRKNKIYLIKEVPLLNAFSFKPNEYEKKVALGFLGFGLGLEYYYKSNQYLSFRATGALGSSTTSTRTTDCYGYIVDRDVYKTLFLSLAHGHRFDRLHLGYGLQFSHNTWSYHDDSDGYEEDLRPSIYTKNNMLGLALTSKFELGRKVDLKLQYNPSFYNLSAGKTWKYESYVSLGVEFRIMIKR